MSPVLLQVLNNQKHSVTELEVGKNMATTLPGMALQPLYTWLINTIEKLLIDARIHREKNSVPDLGF